MDDPAVKALRDALVQTLSTNPAVIKQAEAALKEAAARPGYALALLKLVATDAPVELRQSAAVNFKNNVKLAWPPPSDADAEAGTAAAAPVAPLPPADRAAIKAILPGLMLSTPPVVRAQLSEALVVVGRYDFPAAWPELLPDLVARLRSAPGGSPAAHGVLATANAIYKRYRGAFMTDKLSAELDYSQALVGPLLDALNGALEAARAAAAATPPDARAAATAVDTARLACRVFYSLNSPGLTEDFERALDGWMAALRSALALDCPPAAVPARDGEPSPLDALRAAVCDNVNLFVEVNEEEFAPYLPPFATDVWAVLVAAGASPARDALATAATRFLTTVARGVHASLFTADGALAQVIESVVLLAAAFRDDDADAFQHNYVDYVRADAEAADVDTRRRAATELMRALADRFPDKVGPLVGGIVQKLLADAGAPAPTPTGVTGDWRAKNAAVYLVSALAGRARAGGAAAGAAAPAAAGAALVDVPAFYAAHVAPQLSARAAAPPAATLGADVLAADALRFLTAFREALPPASLAAALADVVAVARCEACVVHSYAATALDRLVSPRRAGAPPLVPRAALAPHLGAALTALFGAFEEGDSAENEYVARGVARVMAAAGPDVAPFAPTALARLSTMLLDAARNPSHPGFNHWLFEGVAVVARAAAPAGEPAIAAVEAALFPAFNTILQNDVQEFAPYTFQLLAQLVEARPAPPAGGAGGEAGAPPPPPLPPVYMTILPPLLAPTFWERPANVPALARLLRALLVRAGGAVAAAGQLEPALGALQKLVSLKSADAESGPLALALLRGVPAAALDPYLAPLWSILFRRLQAARTPRFVRSLLLFTAGFALLRGPAPLVASVDGVQAGLFAGALVAQVWAPALAPSVAGGGREDAKLLLAGTGRVLADVGGLAAADAGAWAALAGAAALAAAGAGAAAAAPASVPALDGGDDDGTPAGYGAAYTALAYAAPSPDDLVPGAPSPAAALAAELGRAPPGALAPLAARLAPEAGAALQAVLGGGVA